MKPSSILLTLVLLTSLSGAEEALWSAPRRLLHREVEVQILNWELTRDRKTLLVHAKLRSQASEDLYFDWRDFFTLESSEGNSLSPNFDALVDRNGAGLTRTVGEFRMTRGERVRLTVPFLLEPSELPARLKLPDGSRSVLIP